jgi:uncharacterized membrane protein
MIAAVVAWFIADRMMRVVGDRVSKLESAIRDLELRVQQLGGAAPSAGPSAAPAEASPQPEPRALTPEAATPPPETPVPAAAAQPEPATPLRMKPASSGPSFEERVGTRWAVWVGGAALAVGGIFLVNYSIEAGLLGPTTRVVLGSLFALALIAAGEWMRRGERALPIDVIPSAHIPGILTAAGTVVLFGTIYAAHALYGLIGPGLTFLLLGAAGLATMLASALHGPALAGIGLIGAMMTPLLINSSEPNPWPVVLFLAVVSASALALARLRHWLWLALASVAGVVLWGLALASQGGDVFVSASFVHALIQLGLAAAFLAVEPHMLTPDSRSSPDGAAGSVLAALLLLVVVTLAGAPATGDTEWMLFAAAAIAILGGTAWISASAAMAIVYAGIVAIAAALLWQGLDAPAPASNLWPAVGAVLRVPAGIHLYLKFIAVCSLAVTAMATLRLHAGRELPLPTAGLFALAATVTPIAALVIAYLRITQFDTSIPFALFGVALALIFVEAADRFQKSEGEPPAPAPHLAAGAFAAAAIAALSFILVVLLDRGYLTVALAVSALGTSYVAVLKRIPLLRYAVGALGVVVLGRVLWDPAINGADVGSWPIFNWLLIGYGVPAVSFALSASLLRAQGEDFPVRLADALAVIFAGLLAFFEIRHLTHGGNPLAPGSSFLEQGLVTLVSLGFAAALLKMDLARSNPVFHWASYVAGAFAVLFAVGGLAVSQNPYFKTAQISGGWLINDLVPAYLLPSLMALYLARISRGVRPVWYTAGAAGIAFLLAFLFVTLSVRHLFHGAVIASYLPASDPEQWAYSVAWLGLGLLLLGYGIWRSSPEARLASGALVLLATLKVFLFDLSDATGLWRALSFICLGLVLIGIGLAYQRLLFPRPRPGANDAAAGPGQPEPTAG